MLFRQCADRQIRGDQVAVDAGKTVGIQVLQIRRFHVLAEEPEGMRIISKEEAEALIKGEDAGALIQLENGENFVTISDDAALLSSEGAERRKTERDDNPVAGKQRIPVSRQKISGGTGK